MAKFTSTLLPKRIAELCNNLFWLTVKLRKTAASIGFIKNCLYLHVTPKFAELRGQFTTKEEKYQAERNLIASHVTKHIRELKHLIQVHTETCQKLRLTTGSLLFNLLYKRLLDASKKIRKSFFITKNEKLSGFIKSNNRIKISYDVPVINLSSIELTDVERRQLSFGLDYSFIDKNKHIKKNLAANLESLAQTVDKKIKSEEKEEKLNIAA